MKNQTTQLFKSALLVIDMQESFRQRPLWDVVSNPQIDMCINELVDDARTRGELVVWILHSEPGSGGTFDPASGHVRFLDGLVAPRNDEPVITKTVHNAFTTTNLGPTLVSKGIQHVAISGIRTEQCCETTARVANDLGFAVSFVTDATATNPIPHWSLPASASVEEIMNDQRTLLSAQIIERTEFALAGRFAEIASVASWTGRARD
jgi:nicotinamidase-related amidase